MKRTPLTRSTPLQRSGNMRQRRQVPRRRPASDIPTQSRTLVRQRDADTCVMCLVVLGGGGHWHHRRTRSVNDEHRHCPCVGVILCSACHRKVHANPAASRLTGLIVSRYEANPSEIPFRSGPIWIFPMCSGSVHLVTATDLDEAIAKRFARGTTTSGDAEKN